MNARGRSDAPATTDAAPVSAPHAAIVASEPLSPLTQPVSSPATREPRRDLFRFVESPPRVVAPARVQIIEQPKIQAPVAEPPVVIREELKPAVQRPQFGYSYIGHFGPRGSEIAVFRGPDGVLNRRSGEAVDATFTLKRIGLESVEIAANDGMVERVELTKP